MGLNRLVFSSFEAFFRIIRNLCIQSGQIKIDKLPTALAIVGNGLIWLKQALMTGN